MSRYTPLPPQNFGGLPEEYSSYETSRAVIFPVPLERTATYERGTRNGPAAILEASRHMEMFDEELETDFSQEIGIATWPPIDTQDGTFEEVLRELFSAQLELLDAGKFPVALGGEHSLTPPLVAATMKKFKDLTVLHIGAHAEQRNEYQGNPGSHVCTMRRVVEMCPAVQVGDTFVVRRGIASDSQAAHQNLLGQRYRARAGESLDRESAGRFGAARLSDRECGWL